MQTATPPRVHEVLDTALRHQQNGRFLEAERLYAQILETDPRHVDALHLLGVLAYQTGRQAEAVRIIGEAIAENPRVPAFHNNLGNALKALGRWDEADAAFERATVLDPRYVEAHYNRGLMRQAQGRLDEAAASYSKVLAQRPDHAEAYNNLGNVLQSQGRLPEALAAYDRALHYRPRFADAHSNAGNVLRAQGNLAGAVESHARALSCDARHAEALRNLGIVLLEQGRLEESATALHRALAVRPHDPAAHCNLGNTLTQQGRAAAAMECYRRALGLDADLGEAALGLATAAIPIFSDSIADNRAALPAFDRALDELAGWDFGHPGRLGAAVGSHQPFYLAYVDADVRPLLMRYGDIVSAAAACHWQPLLPAPAPRSRRQRLRLVIVSGQVRRHPVWDVILRGLVAHLDRRQFEVHLHHTGCLRDEQTSWAEMRVDRFVQGPKPLASWMDDIAAARPDVLLYPEVGMDPTAAALASLRLAPVQIASWGHPVTTGLPTIDCFLSGMLLEGPDAEAHYRERLVRLPGTGVCTDGSALEARDWEAPKTAPGVVRFAICQQPIKFDPADDEILVRIASAAGPCEFWLPSPLNLPWAAARLRERLATAFRAAGLDPRSCLRIMPWLPPDQFLGFLDAMDVFLDCPGFSGYTTAWQAVHRGTPVVTLEGRYLRQRLAAGILRKIGIEEGIAASRESYVETAVRFAHRSREPKARRLRQSMSAAAAKADGNLDAVRSLEELLIESASRNGASRAS